MENRWYIQITGTESDISDVERSLKTYMWKLYRDKDGVYLTSNNLNDISDAVEVRSLAEEFIDTLNGAISYIYDDYEPIRYQSTIEYNKITGQRIVSIGPVSMSFKLRMRATLTIKGQNEPMETSVEKWLKVSKKSEAVRSVLHYYNNPNWWNLYKIYEVIKEDLGGDAKIRSKQFATKKEISSFTGTANSRLLLGDEARHADSKNQGPQTPINLAEARRWIKNLSQKWIDEKLNKKG